MKNTTIIAIAFLITFGQAFAQPEKSKKTAPTEHYTFKLSDRVNRQKVRFKNRYGITLTGDLSQKIH